MNIYMEYIGRIIALHVCFICIGLNGQYKVEKTYGKNKCEINLTKTSLSNLVRTAENNCANRFLLRHCMLSAYLRSGLVIFE